MDYNIRVSFELSLTGANSKSPVELASKEHFQLREPRMGEAVVLLTRSIQGPQEIELDVIANFWNQQTRTSWKAVAKLFIFVSQFEY